MTWLDTIAQGTERKYVEKTGTVVRAPDIAKQPMVH